MGRLAIAALAAALGLAIAAPAIESGLEALETVSAALAAHTEESN